MKNGITKKDLAQSRCFLPPLVGLAMLFASIAWASAGKVSAPLIRFGSGNEAGTITYSKVYEGDFTATLELSGLKPQGIYMLTLNGKPNLPGNHELKSVGQTLVTGGVEEGYLDFQTIRAGADGGFLGLTVSVTLPAGQYDIKFFVKDVGQNYRVVLGLDILRFSVRLPPLKGQAQIAITRIVPNDRIEGKVTGLGPAEYKKYKVLVYVRTDKWYIHPFERGGEGLSFASIRPDGTWRIGTVKRQFAADEVAALLVDAAYNPPAQVDNIWGINAVDIFKEEGGGRL